VNDELCAEIREAALADRYLVADPDAQAEPLPVATGHLTRETLDAAIARLNTHELRVDPVYAHAEIALARWLEQQPPGTAEKLLRQMYGATEDQ
jgi:hypothetical protein